MIADEQRSSTTDITKESPGGGEQGGPTPAPCDDVPPATDTSVPESALKSDAAHAGSQGGDGSTTTAVTFGEKLEDRVAHDPVACAQSVTDDTTKLSVTADTRDMTNKDTTSSDTPGTQTTFVFGSNCAERAVFTPGSQGGLGATTGEQQNLGGSSFSNDLSAGATDACAVSPPPMSLAESAASVQAKQKGLELKEVEVLTGEENESNVFKFNAKLYVFEKETQSWQERGRGLLRLNDMAAHADKPFQSRIVMRTQGSLRVILNTLIWPGMLVERASPKSIQITAADGDDGIKIFLISASQNDAELMYGAIYSRAQQLKAAEPPTRSKSSTAVPPTAHPTANETAQANYSCVGDVGSVEQGEETGEMEGKETEEGMAKLGKRPVDWQEGGATAEKRQKLYAEQKKGAYQNSGAVGEDSNDSSALDPETEASNEGFASSPTIQSSSSDA